MMLFPVSCRAYLRMFLKVVGEMRRFRKAQPVANLLNGNGGMLQQAFGLGNGLFRDPGTNGLPGFTFDHITEIIGMEMLRICIILHPEHPLRLAFAKLAEVFFEHQLKTLHDLRTPVALVDRVIILPKVFFDL